jgi:glycosyltransferase involved in cell wall biosynthesis
MTVVAIVQLPPPVTGLSTVNQQMVMELARSGKLKTVVNVAPPVGARGGRKQLARLGLTAKAALTLLRARRDGATTLYMPSDGGWGMIWNITLVGVARLFGYRLWVHHHSFAYINRRSWLFALQLWIAPYRSHHIALCESMLEALERLYQPVWSRRGHSGRVLSNAFMAQPPTDPTPRSGSFVIGHLANLTAEKGSLRFIDLFRAARTEGLDLTAQIAGPIGDAATQQAIEAAVRDHGETFQWLGPVYGTDKSLFYSSIDAFVFPSSYANEAQPLVLLEALGGGAAVLATTRGCMACDHASSPGIISSSAEFHDRALAWLRESGVGAARSPLPFRAAEALVAMQVRAQRQLAEIVAEI